MDFSLKKSIFITKNILRPHALCCYNTAKKNELLQPGELAELNFQKRRRIVIYAYSHSLFYRRWYDDHGFHPSMLNSEDDWDRVPIIGKEDIRKNMVGFFTSGGKYCQESTTGGSTGEPLRIYHDTRFPLEIIGWRMLSWFGRSPADNIAMVYRRRTPSRIRQLLNDMLWFPTRRILLDASSFNSADIETFLKKADSVHPEIIQGYVGAVTLLAEYLRDHRTAFRPPSLCWVTSAPLPENQRQLLKDVFRCDILDQYGCCEIFWLAAESPEHSGLHVFDDFRNIDTVGDDGIRRATGQYGDIVVTDLENRAFPLIRYRNGDRGMKLDRSGSRLPFSLLAPVKGRISDFVRLPDGGIVSGEFLTTIFDDASDSIVGFQVVQHANGNLTVRYVAAPNASESRIAGILEVKSRMLEEKVRKQVVIAFQRVDRIMHDKGKIRYVIREQ